jgi:hypothetical protein
MTNDYSYVMKVITNKNNNRYHYPALKRLISIWEIKWQDAHKEKYFDIYLHSLKTTLKRSFSKQIDKLTI